MKENGLTSNTINRGQILKITLYKKVLSEELTNSSNQSNNSTKKTTESRYSTTKNKKQESKTDKRRDRSKKELSKNKKHTVKSGESLDRIAKKYGVTVNELKRANNIKKNNNTIHPGDKLKIPAKKKSKSKRR